MGINKAVARWSIGNLGDPVVLVVAALQLDVHEDALSRDDRVLIVDDVLATGGTAAAAVELVRKLGGDVVGVQVLIELSALAGRKRLSGIDVVSELVY